MNIALDPGEQGRMVVRLRGRLDLLSATEVKQAIARAVAEGHPKVIADLQEVSFVDSSGLGALIGGLKAARQAGGDLRLAHPQEQARLILELTTLDRVLTVYPSLEEALAAW